jgi:16S rRNA processing protein RimM
MARRVAGSRRERGPAPLPQGEPDLVVVGRIGRPQGIKGEVTVEVRTDDPEARFAPGATLLSEHGPLTVAQARDHSGRLVVLFEGVADRNGAEALRGRLLQVDARTLPALEDEDDFYDSQLVGLRALLEDGTELGPVADVLHLPHGDVLVVAFEGREVLVPFVKAIVPTVELAAGTLVVAPPPGLLDLES